MDNSLPFSSNSNANSFPEELSLDCNYNPSLFSTIPTYAQAQPQPLLLPYSYPVEQIPVMMNPHEAFPQFPAMQTGIEFGSFVNNPGLRLERGGFHDPHMKKLARINRKNAMIRSRNNPSPSSSANEFLEARKQVMLKLKKRVEPTVIEKDVYLYSSFDNKKLRVLLMKHLKNSDVGSLGRMVLPKREAERNLPELTDKEGIIVEMRNVDSIQSWSFKYKFWSNNKSRMYVLENTGDFVRSNGAEIGDYLTIYEDESKNLYFSIRKSYQPNEGRENDSTEVNEMNQYEDMLLDYMIPRDEEEASIAMLIGNLKDQYPNPNDLMGLTIDHQATSSSTPVDHVHIPQHVGSSYEYDDLTLNDFQW